MTMSLLDDVSITLLTQLFASVVSPTILTIRRARSDDAPECARICFDAFYKVNADHNFPPEMPDRSMPKALLGMMFSHPGFYAVVAESGGRIVGSNCLDERSTIFGVGPITIDPAVQNSGIGRQLMQAVLDRPAERGAPGVRLLQSAFHNRSLSLYAKLGFDPRQPISVMTGSPLRLVIDGFEVRVTQPADISACDRLCLRVHGHTRSGELSDAVKQGQAFVVERDGYITACGQFIHRRAGFMINVPHDRQQMGSRAGLRHRPGQSETPAPE